MGRNQDMRFKSHHLWAAFAAVALLFGGVSSTHANSGAQKIAGGQGFLFSSDADLGANDIRQFSFNVREMPDGTVQGKATLVQVGGIKVWVDVNSYEQDSTGILWVGGPITRTQGDEAPPVGDLAVFGVKDGGAGGSADEISLLFSGPPEDADASGTVVPTTTIQELISLLSTFGLPNSADALRFVLTPPAPRSLLKNIDAGNVTIF